MLRRVFDGLFQWSRFQPERGYDFTGTAITAPTEVLLVDPIAPDDAELAELRALGKKFRIVLLNADHERDAARLAPELGAAIHVARADLAAVKAPGAIGFDDGAAFPGGWTAVVLDDLKTPGESALFNAARRLAIMGDAVIADPITGLRLVPPMKLKDRDRALASLGRLADLDFDGLLTGDGFQLPSGGRAALRRFLQKEGRS